jgi:hypothetical protein
MKVRTLGALGAVLVIAGACFGQLDPGDLKFNGVGLGSTYGQVVKALGKPSSETKPMREECIGGREKSAKYQGASLVFMDEVGKTFKVMAFDVTSPKYVVSGIKVGDTQLTVRRVLGSKFTSEPEAASGSTTWTYEMDGETGSTRIKFKKGKVVEISSGYLVC